MVYVDAPIWKYKRMIMCHMLSDTLEELHQMADNLGINRKHFQDKKAPHYDICKQKRTLAIKLGAKEINRKETVMLIKTLKSKK